MKIKIVTNGMQKNIVCAKDVDSHAINQVSNNIHKNSVISASSLEKEKSHTTTSKAHIAIQSIDEDDTSWLEKKVEFKASYEGDAINSISQAYKRMIEKQI